MNTKEKKQIISLITKEKERYASFNRLSRACGVSNATISNMINNKWDNISDEIWNSVAKALGYKSQRWKIADTYNLKQMFQVINTARQTKRFWAVSCKAGSGKTTSMNLYAQNNTCGVYYIQAQEWTQRQFLLALAQTLGIEPTNNGYNSVAMILEQICSFFIKRVNEEPILLIDEADKLKDGAKRMLIPLFNKLEDKLSCVIAGTDNLEFEIKRGVRNAKKGFDEIDSRFGRTYFKLTGATLKDVEMICKANGVDNFDTIKKIFNQAKPISEVIGGISTKIVEDMRPVKNLILAEKALKMELCFA